MQKFNSFSIPKLYRIGIKTLTILSSLILGAVGSAVSSVSSFASAIGPSRRVAHI
jgi:hypothetical protein